MDSLGTLAAKDLWFCRQEQIERALKRGYDPMPIEGVTKMLDEGAAQVWFAENSTIVTEIYDRGNKRVCEIWLAGGDMEELIELKNEEIEPWAREMGCNRMLIIGRRGWERALPDYKYASVALIKEFEG